MRNIEDLSFFDILAFSVNSQTSVLVVDFHPGQVSMIDYLITCGRFPFRDRDAVIRWCVAWGLYALLEQRLDVATLAAAKNYLLQEDELQHREECTAVSVQKYLAAGQPEHARRLVEISLEEYSQISVEYWRMRSLSTLTPAIEILQAHGINLRQLATKEQGYAAD